MQQLCQDRGSICATTEGFGPPGWYFNEAETDFWQVWHSLAQSYTLDPARTVISGYSMGGWASYKLAFEHPTTSPAPSCSTGRWSAASRSTRAPVAPRLERPGCARTAQVAAVANARWMPYVIDQTYADELVPTTGVIAQAQAFDGLGQRYDLFIHTGGDHWASRSRTASATWSRARQPGADDQPGRLHLRLVSEPEQLHAGDRRHRRLRCAASSPGQRLRDDRRPGRRRLGAPDPPSRFSGPGRAGHPAAAGYRDDAELEPRSAAGGPVRLMLKLSDVAALTDR